MTLKLNGSSSGYTAIDAPATAGSNTLVLPADNGSNGEFLKTNGSGVLDWAAATDTNDTNSPSIGVGRNADAWGIASDVWILIPFNVTNWNVGGGTWTAASGGDTTGSYYTLPSDGAGKYVCSYGIGCNGLDDGESIRMRLCKNGGPTGHWADSSVITKTYAKDVSPQGGDLLFINNTVILDLANSDRIQPQVLHNEGAGNLHLVENSQSSVHFSMFKLAGV